MPIDLYQLTGSSPCRTVRLAAAAIGVDLNLKNVDLKAGEHLKSEFIKYQLVVTGVTPEQAKYDKMNDVLSFLDKFLEGENYVAGKTLTLADLALVVTISNYQVENSKYSNILRWFAKIQAEAPKYNEVEGIGIKAFRDLVENARKKK
ncbi:Glutathione S-transferase 1, isoform D [Atta colombica]|uniref:Glutathione S-transferase 1, isoform D n=1 Tax=Atta colombica TaxID=520822 RepID=A0A195B277_9HYME|nr:Glutathione S-transferase 1, isoform D [Atta colombica]